jgi:hypothetical protein
MIVQRNSDISLLTPDDEIILGNSIGTRLALGVISHTHLVAQGYLAITRRTDVGSRARLPGST